MDDTEEFYHQPYEAKELSTVVVTAATQAHDGDVLNQTWLISEKTNMDALNGPFQEA